VKDWLSIKEAAYVVNRDRSRISRWIDKGWLTWRRTDEGFIEVATEDVRRMADIVTRGRPRTVPRDTPTDD